MVYAFEGHVLDVERRELRRSDRIVPVEPQVFDLLRYLITNRTRVVSKDELLAEVWGRRIVSESTLSSRIASLRQAVGDSGEHQRVVRTVARRGFRFVAVVQEAAARERSGTLDSDTQPDHRDPSTLPSSRPPNGPERRQVTIMACGLVGAARLASRLDPEDLRAIATGYRECVKGAVERHGGTVTQYTADGLLALFGYPRAHEDDAERAVRAGLAAIEAVAALRALSVALQARAGIATGLVVIGECDAAGATLEPSLVGQAPHLASRLLEASDAGALAISASTRELIGNLFEYYDLAQLDAMAGNEPVRAWRVVREAATADRFQALRPRREQLVGRDEELDLLLRRWNQAKTGEGRVVLIWGEAGIGKSHLMASLQEALGSEPHACVRYFCSPHRAQTALHPVINQLEHAAGFTPADSDDEKLEKLTRLLAQLSKSEPQDVDLFADLLSVARRDRSAPLALSSQRRKALVFERSIAQLASLAARGPVLVLLEDAHWIDPTTRELFDLVIDRVRSLPVLLVMSYRPEFTPPWLGQAHVTALTLNRLGRRASAALMTRVTGGKVLPDALLERMLSQADGVPLFIEEVTKSVLESGVVREEDGAYALAGPLANLAVPSTLQASLVARFDRIEGTRALVQTSAALGREFRYDALKAVVALGDAALEPLLEQLVASGLVHQRGSPPDAEYLFRHALVQDAAYETMLKSQRLAVHRRIVEVFERDFPETAAHQPDVMAYHCREAGLTEKAIDYSILAARMALERSAGVEAQALVETAMSLLPTLAAGDVRRNLDGRLQVALADALMMTKGFASPDVMATLSRARGLLDETAQPIESLRALCGLFNYHLMRSESPRCLELTEAKLKHGLDRPTATVVRYLTGTAQLHLGNFKVSNAQLESALALYDEDSCRTVAFVPGYHLRCFTLIWLGLGTLYVGSLERAAATISAAVQDARSRDHPFTLVSALLALARFCNHTQDVQSASAAVDEGLAIATEQRSPYHVSRANILRAVGIIESGRPEEGIALMEHALAEHRGTGANFQSSFNLTRLAEAYARAGRLGRALDLAAEAVAEVDRTGERWWEAEAKRSHGEILLLAGPAHRAEAERCFGQALDCARRQEARLWELNAARSLATMHLAQGRADDARALLAPVCGAFADGVDNAGLRSAKAMLRQLA